MPENLEVDLSQADVMLEITRWCNMDCPHCIRGNKQKHKMPLSIIDKVDDIFPSINTLIFTGGEITLAPDVMEYAIDRLSYNNFWIAINGSVFTPKIRRIIEKGFANAAENEASGMRVSFDPYHDKDLQSKYSREFYEEWLEMSGLSNKFSIEFAGAPADSSRLVNDGRAALFFGTDRFPKHKIILQHHYFYGDFYVNVFGNLISTCDLSYKKADRKNSQFKVGNIMTDNIDEKINDFFSKHPELITKE